MRRPPFFRPLATADADSDIERLREEVLALREEVEVDADDPRIAQVHAQNRASAQNLLSYLALRRDDLRPLQRRLAARGLSSIGRAEAHVLATLDAVLAVLGEDSDATPAPVNFEEGDACLRARADALLGPVFPGRGTRIMVTLPSEAATEPDLVRALVAAGMDVARINCAHDDQHAWTQMIDHVRAAEREVGRTCRIAMDLSGPKLRTGPLAPGPRVLKVKPRRDAFGRVAAAARVWLAPEPELDPASEADPASPPEAAPVPPPEAAGAVVPVAADWLARRREGDRIRFIDARGRRRVWTVAEAFAGGRWAEAERTAYVVPGLDLDQGGDVAAVGIIAACEAPLHLSLDDRLLLMASDAQGRPAIEDDEGCVIAPARIGCALPDVLADVRPGEPVWFDDGSVGGIVEASGDEGAVVRITRAGPTGRKLRADKGINLPESTLHLDALTEKDREDLPFVVSHADIVDLSFANGPADVIALQEAMAEIAPPEAAPHIVVKVETRRGFEALPEMLLAAMRAPSCGVMIARGDLAVECGFERLAEVQEEILWVCEAAHVPVVWATQVLETLAKTGLPSRAEVTDAAMGHRAECVMLNKGPHVLDAVATLGDIFARMGEHQIKKRSELRALSLAR